MPAMFMTMVDERAGGTSIHEFDVAVESQRMTVQEIIASRVEAEVRNYNSKLPEYFQGLVQPTDAERTLNGYRMKHRQEVDPEKQVYIALGAFQKNGFFLLIDDLQAEDLNQVIEVRPGMRVSFVKLTPLVGG